MAEKQTHGSEVGKYLRVPITLGGGDSLFFPLRAFFKILNKPGS